MENPFEIINNRLNNMEAILNKIFEHVKKEEPPAEEPFIKMEEVCKIWDVSAGTIHNYKKTGKLPFYRMGNKVYFKKSEVIEAMTKVKASKQQW